MHFGRDFNREFAIRWPVLRKQNLNAVDSAISLLDDFLIFNIPTLNLTKLKMETTEKKSPAATIQVLLKASSSPESLESKIR